nr:hypothetical protein HJG59_010919 [Molossus molossus]
MAEAVPEAQDTVQVIPGSRLLWRINTRPPNSAQMYNFTSFTVSLNELPAGMEKVLAPTDCRLRPDIRSMENGNMDLASQEKERLEEKQRAARRERAKDEVEWQTRWFHQGRNPHTGAPDWLYSGGYFERDFTGCPDIY